MASAAFRSDTAVILKLGFTAFLGFGEWKETPLCIIAINHRLYTNWSLQHRA